MRQKDIRAETKRQGERKTETERQGERGTEGQRDRETERKRDRETERQRPYDKACQDWSKLFRSELHSCKVHTLIKLTKNKKSVCAFAWVSVSVSTQEGDNAGSGGREGC